LVVVLHGGGGNAASAISMTGMSDEADREGFLVAYPDGSGRAGDRRLTWNAGTCCGVALDQGVDDVGFVRALIAALRRELDVDPDRIFVTGLSNGAQLAYRLGCELSDTIAAIAPVSGSLAAPNCAPPQPVSAAIFHGTADQHILYDGGVPRVQDDWHARDDPPVSSAVAFWVAHNTCPPTPLREQTGNVVRDTYADCTDGTAVVLYTIVGGGHAWPGGQRGTPQGDAPARAPSATNEMWQFFVRHPKRTR
jgi:polyhydroxybutyrate depolymerase